MAIFTWFPDASHTMDVEPRVMSAKFGDGYEQRVADGLNTQMQQWALVFTGGRTETTAIADFLKARNGTEAFTWTNPDEEVGLYICRKWSKNRTRGVKVTLSCTFEQVPA